MTEPHQSHEITDSSRPTTAVAQKNQVPKTQMSLAQLVKLDKYASAFQRVLGNHAPQFVSSLIQVGASSALQGCEPRSIIASAMTAACLDLPIDRNLGLAHIVPYAGKAVFQIGYKGLIQLALRSGQYARMGAHAVNAEVYCGRDEIGEPKLDWNQLDDSKPKVGYAFTYRLMNGFTKCAYWPREKVLAHAEKYSQAYRKKKPDSAWFTAEEVMCLKTVISDTLRKWGMLSIHLQIALNRDNTYQLDVDAEVMYPDDAPEEPSRPVFPKKDTAGLLASPKPRGRPPGSKNKPKEELALPLQSPDSDQEEPAEEIPPSPAEASAEATRQASEPSPASLQDQLSMKIHDEGKVSFEDFRRWLVRSDRAKVEVAGTWESIDFMPDAICKALLDAPADLDRCIRIHGKKTEQRQQ